MAQSVVELARLPTQRTLDFDPSLAPVDKYCAETHDALGSR